MGSLLALNNLYRMGGGYVYITKILNIERMLRSIEELKKKKKEYVFKKEINKPDTKPVV